MKETYFRFMACVPILNEFVNCNKRKLLLLRISFRLKERGLKDDEKKILKRTEKRKNKFIKPGLKKTSPIISAGVAAKTKYPQPDEVTSKILR